MRIITSDDFIDTYCKFAQRGSRFFFSKFTFSNTSRTKSAFSDSVYSSSNWWIIPAVRNRWNEKITGNADTNYKQYLYENFIRRKSGMKLLSLGSGACSHELELAGYSEFDEIVCLDLAQNLLNQAAAIAKKENKNNIKFICADIKNFDFKTAYYDFVLFNASLHHFDQVDELLGRYIKPCLKPNGKLVINEFVGPTRQQFPKQQLDAIKDAIKLIDKPYRRRFKTSIYKNSFSGAGMLRMIIADPSECVDSDSIMPAIHRQFKTIVEKPYGGNILMNVLRDISHHFVVLDDRKSAILQRLFEFEDHYLEKHKSDFVFGIYQKPN